MLTLGFVAAGAATSSNANQVKQPFIKTDAKGTLSYQADAKGNRIPDFSAAGYGGGGVSLPIAPVRVVVAPVAGDNGERIQAALDYVGHQPADAHGLRGAVLLQPGRYEIAGQLRLRAPGVVLRGAGSGADGTVLVATGTDRRTLIEVAGQSDRTLGPAQAIPDAYVPVGATSFTISAPVAFKVGDRVVIERPSPKKWIETLGMNDAPARQPFEWRAGKMNISWDRTIVALDGTKVTLDAPLTTALERDFDGGTIRTYAWPGRIAQVGVEHLRCESAFDPANPKDEQHAWIAVSLDAVENAWVCNVVASHFASSAVRVGGGARAVTVQDCISLAPVSELAGYRRHSFHTAGQLTLFQRCRTENGLHDFTVGYLAGGPNVFLDCQATNALGFSGSIGSWASGVLFDTVSIDGAGLQLDNLETWNQGVGWSAANSVLWQCSASVVTVRQPPAAQNWAIGVWGEFVGDGAWDQVNEFVNPDSLYRAQLAQRLGPPALAALAKTAPPVAASAAQLETVVKLAGPASRRDASAPDAAKPLALSGGWLTANGSILPGSQVDITWWRGSVSPAQAGEFGPNLTRFVPGQVGPGLTDDLPALASAMTANHDVALRHHWGLWYEQRSNDHERVRRISADTWPPFYDQPWLRSGQGEAWDRLSRYDLTRYNPWYFSRLQQFAALGRERGLVLVNEMYFQHNILEAGAHWATFPWRPANCLQETGFPEPPPYAGDKRIFMADLFYDVSDPVRRSLHRAYVRQCLSNLAGEPNVIHTTGEEYTGPLSFVEFWLDVVAEWKKETGQHPLIALSATKEVQDAILADPARSSLIDVIDLKYWWKSEKGLHAPRGGENLSPRQQERLWRGGRPSAATLAEMVLEYRGRFPGKAVITGLDQRDGWAFASAGGSFPRLPRSTDPALLAAMTQMKPASATDLSRGLIEPGRQALLYAPAGGDVALDPAFASGEFMLRRVDPASGKPSLAREPLSADVGPKLRAPKGVAALFWITKK